MKKEYKPNWVGILIIILYSCIFALIGIGMIPIILKVNNYQVSYFYAQWVSYVTVIIFSYLFLYNIKLTKEKTNTISFIEKFMKDSKKTKGGKFR